MSKLKFSAVILGSDNNAYGMARSFHEEYGIKSIILTKFDMLPTMHSNIVEKIYIKNLDDPDTFSENLIEVLPRLKKHAEKLILISVNENYAKLCITNKDKLKDKYILPYIDKELMDSIIYKEKFYELCEKYDLDFPKTLIYEKNMDLDKLDSINFPIVIKPSDSVTYFEADFSNKEKAYIVNTKDKAIEIIDNVYKSTYSDNLIIQDYIPGDDRSMRVLNAYVDQNSKVKMMTLGKVVLEDCNPELLGNYIAIMPDYDKDLYLKYTKFLEELGYVGFANFDLKFDKRDGKYKVFELNVRQGRSSYFVTASGYNIAKYLVNDRIKNLDLECDYSYGNSGVFWHSIPLKNILNLIDDSDIKEYIVKAKKAKKTYRTLYYKNDKSLIRRLKLDNYYRNYSKKIENCHNK